MRLLWKRANFRTFQGTQRADFGQQVFWCTNTRLVFRFSYCSSKGCRPVFFSCKQTLAHSKKFLLWSFLGNIVHYQAVIYATFMTASHQRSMKASEYPGDTVQILCNRWHTTTQHQHVLHGTWFACLVWNCHTFFVWVKPKGDLILPDCNMWVAGKGGDHLGTKSLSCATRETQKARNAPQCLAGWHTREVINCWDLTLSAPTKLLAVLNQRAALQSSVV